MKELNDCEIELVSGGRIGASILKWGTWYGIFKESWDDFCAGVKDGYEG